MARADALPAVDERLVAPGCGYEIYDGRVVKVPPCDPPHGECQSRLAALLEAHVGDGYKKAVDMLTRTSELDDIAPDASIFPRAPAPGGGRQLEEVAFEIANTQTRDNAARKAHMLVERGVRRVFLIDVEPNEVFEWFDEIESWVPLPRTMTIDDPVFVVPLPVEALVTTVGIDDAIARALLARNNAVLASSLAASRSEGRSEGRIEGRIEGLLLLVASRGIVLTDGERAQLEGERDPARVERWMRAAVHCTSVAELLAL